MNQPAKATQISLVFLAICSLLFAYAHTAAAQVAPESPTIESATSPAPVLNDQVMPPAEPPAQSVLATPVPIAAPIDQTELKLVAIPARYGDAGTDQLILKPGEKRQINLRVNNDTTEPVTIKSLAEDFVIGEDGYSPVPIDSQETDNRWSMANWMTITPSKQTIPPKQTAGVSVTIEVPEDALPGGHYVMVMHQVDTAGSLTGVGPGETSNIVNQRVGTLVYGVVEGQYIESAYIRDLTVPQLSEFGPIPYSFRIDNESDVHIRPQLSAKIYNLWGKELSATALDSKNIFPKDSRDFAGQWDQIWGLGRYKLEISMVYGTAAANTAIMSTYFWIIPIKLILAALVGVLTILAIIILIRRHYLHRKKDQSARVKELEQKVAELENNQPKG